VPQHLVVRSKSFKRHQRRDAAKKRWKARQEQTLALPNFDSGRAQNIVGQVHVLPQFDPEQTQEWPGDPEQNQQGPEPVPLLAPVVSPLSEIVQIYDPNWFNEVFEIDPF
jgi:hypothetical protein